MAPRIAESASWLRGLPAFPLVASLFDRGRWVRGTLVFTCLDEMFMFVNDGVVGALAHPLRDRGQVDRVRYLPSEAGVKQGHCLIELM